MHGVSDGSSERTKDPVDPEAEISVDPGHKPAKRREERVYVEEVIDRTDRQRPTYLDLIESIDGEVEGPLVLVCQDERQGR